MVASELGAEALGIESISGAVEAAKDFIPIARNISLIQSLKSQNPASTN